MKTVPTLTIIIATYNSEKTLQKVLVSIHRQTYPLSKMEILIIDGGSTDATRNIAKSYMCRIIDNPKMLPSWAKFLGYKASRGVYAMFLDSDEVIESSRSIERKIRVLQNNSSVHAVTGSGYISPKQYPFFNSYINEFGDPFSFFIYRLSKDNRFFVDAMIKKYPTVHNDPDHVVFNFSDSIDLPIFELAAMGSMVDLVYLKTHFPEILKNPGLIWHIFNLLVSKKTHIAIIKHDPLMHFSAETPGKYFGKITSRIIRNVFTEAKEGFKGRDEFSMGMNRYKKFLFIPYSLSILMPCIDSAYLSLTRHDIRYFVHIPLCLYTSFLILYYMILKMFGVQPVFKSYGESKPIYQSI